MRVSVARPVFDATVPVYDRAMRTGHAEHDTAAVCAVLALFSAFALAAGATATVAPTLTPTENGAVRLTGRHQVQGLLRADGDHDVAAHMFAGDQPGDQPEG